MYLRLENTVDTFDSETKKNPRILSIGFHPHLIGVPHRIGYLDRMLDLLMARDDTIFYER